MVARHVYHDEKLVLDLGLDNLTPGERARWQGHMLATVQYRVGRRIFQELSAEHREKAEEYVVSENRFGMLRWMNKNVPDRREIIREEFERARREVLHAIENNEEPLSPRVSDEIEEARGDAKYDVFIAHASDDKEIFVRPLVGWLSSYGVRVWYDEKAVRIGDSLIESIEEGLAYCRFGVIVLSTSFFAKRWPRAELNALASREFATGERLVLPIYLDVSADDVRQYSPLLADRYALRADDDPFEIVQHIVRRLRSVD